MGWQQRRVHRIDVAWTPEEWTLDVRNSLADPHANAYGHELIAEKVVESLRAKGFLAP